MKKLLLSLLCLSALGCAKEPEPEKSVDVLLIGGGIMSASLGTYLNELEPTWKIDLYERLPQVAEESSNAWNNAGTGHSALAELNYTPEKSDGSIDISKAITINESFEISKQFWAYQVEQGVLNNPKSFINNVSHMSFVWGDKNTEFLKKRYEALVRSPLFSNMEFSDDPQQIKQWIPLAMEGREPGEKLAATRVQTGTDVNFGEITNQLIDSLSQKDTFNVHVQQEVRDITRADDGSWNVTMADLANGEELSTVNAKFVFIGAGGGALKLLQKSGIPEANGYAGFPVGGSWLVTHNQDVIQQHQAKVYGMASVGSPPMSVPHLDTRVINGKKALLFGPFATFSTKYLKNGSLLDMFSTMTTSNIMPMAHAGLDNLSLSTYLIGQLMLDQKDRMDSLREYYPQAQDKDWEMLQAGQRVQIIKKDEKAGGILQFGTEVVSSQDGSIAALLGASPGASTAAPIMLHLMEKTFKDKVASPEWQAKLKDIIPSYGQTLNDNVELANKTRAWSSERLQLNFVEVKSEQEKAEQAPEAETNAEAL
ncbi:malate dehydrogenase (quinone) [Pseudomonas seleniipraecipitans]|uniref:Probable malate:quinone oxidoreductase n=1 Tax=Phytopseudomonas seleniipraecipitans TaxID=640205 RepID=A0ABY5J7Z1_9GAMM|nr:malate dehydrogenase (quinone) [Pseudomonas seleniipraecipitans]UUD64155.1 malate dehydrogenase (quinone) [Pseudomonas seleniipraecipitans]